MSSPDGRYEIRTYHYDNDVLYRTARAELYEKENKISTTIYFNDYDYSPHVEWLKNDRIRIGREELDISRHEIFDFRQEQVRQTELPPQG